MFIPLLAANDTNKKGIVRKQLCANFMAMRGKNKKIKLKNNEIKKIYTNAEDLNFAGFAKKDRTKEILCSSMMVLYFDDSQMSVLKTYRHLHTHICVCVYVCVRAHARAFVRASPVHPRALINGVMVIIIENGHGDTSSNPGRD